MRTQISLAFEKAKKENRTALLTYTVAGDNTKKKSIEILNSISKYIDICELGFPHNTPIGDGGEIQTSSYRAIKNGIKMNDIFQIVKKYKRNKFSKPVILMGYYNMIYQYGENNFLNKCKKTGVDGLIVVDLPWPENKVFAKINNLYNINQIRRLGLFYFTARVIHPSLVWPKKDKKESKVNDTAKEIQLKFFYDDSNFEDYGRHLLMHLKAK